MENWQVTALLVAVLFVLLFEAFEAHKRQAARDADQREIRDRLRSLDDKTTKHEHDG